MLPYIHNVVGLVGVAVAVATATAAMVDRFTRRRAVFGWVAALALAVMLGSWGGLPAAAYVRGVTGDLSVTTLVLVAHALGRGLFGWPQLTRRSLRALQAFLVAAALLLYPFALGLGMQDPYRLGYANPGFVGAVLALALASWLVRLDLVAVTLALAILAWAFGAFESDNLWDYLIDPVVALYAAGALIWAVGLTWQGRRRAREGGLRLDATDQGSSRADPRFRQL